LHIDLIKAKKLMKKQQIKQQLGEEKGTIIISRRIQLLVHDEANAENLMKELEDISGKVFRMMNMALNEFSKVEYYKEIIESGMVDSFKEKQEEIDKISTKGEKDKAKKEKKAKAQKELDDIKKELSQQLVKDFYGRLDETVGYHHITNMFPEVPSQIKAAANRLARKNFVTNKQDVKEGKVTFSNYKKNHPIPFNLKSGKMYFEDEGGEIIFKLFTDRNYIFKLAFGKDKSNNRAVIEQVMAGNYKFCDSSIQICEDKKNKEKNKNVQKKIFLNAAIQIPKSKVLLDPERVAATNLGICTPLYFQTNKGYGVGLGTAEEFFAVRQQFQKRNDKLKADLKGARSGHGRARKMKAFAKLKTTERNYAKTYNHKLSKILIDYCVKNSIGTLRTEDLLGSKRNISDFVIRNWGYYQLQQQIQYKADRVGIKVVKVMSQNITRKCSCCGNIDKEAVDLKSRTYTCSNTDCKEYGKPINIDKNAALNVLTAQTVDEYRAENKKKREAEREAEIELLD
jgi:IS605 OrfB family transposase